MEISTLARKEIMGMRAYIPGERTEDTMARYGLDHAIKLSSNENPLGPSPKAIEAMLDAAKGVSVYPDSATIALKTAIAKKLGVTFEQVVLGNGGAEIIRLACECFLQPGDEVVLSELGFGTHFVSAQFMGAKCVTVPVSENFEDRLELYKSKITEKTKMVFVTNPNNPTGVVSSRDAVEAFLKSMPEDVVIFMDECYFEYAKATHPEYPDCSKYIDQYPNMLVLRTFSKAFGLAGLRIGYALGSEEIISYINRVRGVYNINSMAQVAATAACTDVEHEKNSIEENIKSLDLIREYCDEKGYRYLPTGTNFIFVDLKTDSKALYGKLLEKGIIFRPGYQWGFDNFMRISSVTVSETIEMLETFDNVLNSSTSEM